MIVVSDTSPILNLAVISRLDLLKALYGEVLIPPAVLSELTRGDVGPPLIDGQLHPWILVSPALDRARVAELRVHLDAGEAEAIALALEKKADLADERRGRSIAQSLGLRVTGLFGVLAEAKRAGLIARVQPVLDDLRVRAGFWIAADLYAQVLAALDEG